MKNINSCLLLVLSVSELEFRFTCTVVTDWCFLFVCVVIFRWLICYLNEKSVFPYSVFVCFFSLCCVTHEFFDNFALNLFIRLFWNCCLVKFYGFCGMILNKFLTICFTFLLTLLVFDDYFVDWVQHTISISIE